MIKAEDEIKTFNEFINDLEEDIVIDYNNPKCIDCNDCCTILAQITDKEYKRLFKYFTKDVNGKMILFNATKLLNDSAKEGILYMKCPFSNPLKKCSIYNLRPKVCRDFHCKESLNKVSKENLAQTVDEDKTLLNLILDLGDEYDRRNKR